ncbi:hypothetical protein CR513_33905, partial [Mucuna pruriens]
MKHKQRTVLLSSSKSDNLAEASGSSETSCASPLAEKLTIPDSTTDEEGLSSEGSEIDEEEQIISATPTVCDISEDKLLNQLKELELEPMDGIPNIYAQEKKVTITKDITEEEINDQVVHTVESAGAVTSDNLNKHALYPPGRIMHIVPAHSSENSNWNHDDADEIRVHLYETPRQLYGKLRLSRGMILDHLTNKIVEKILVTMLKRYETSITSLKNTKDLSKFTLAKVLHALQAQKQ